MNIVKSFIEFLWIVLLKFLDDLIHVSGCYFELNLLYIEVINDSKCLGKEPSETRGFRVEKRRRKFGVF